MPHGGGIPRPSGRHADAIITHSPVFVKGFLKKSSIYIIRIKNRLEWRNWEIVVCDRKVSPLGSVLIFRFLFE